ncbi:MAG: hypothetical protein IPG55_06860 [Saprospiraceae bacterium]|nr:hypothetical protein [Candidatus Defluviibacterium haderslevense]MBK7245703.1 hypothetical protein [Candidatus Defluviibacterium haderslevense]
MEINNNYRNTVGWITILSGIIGFVSYFLVAGSVNFNFDFFSNPVLIFSIPNVHIGMLRWSMISDIFGYYLLLLPALFLMNEWLRDITGWRTLITFCGTSYILLGAIGAAILAVTWPSFLVKFPAASPEQQETIKLLFDTFSQMVYGGLWNLLDTIFGGVWFVGIGIFILRDKYLLRWFTIIVGVISLLDGVGNIFEIQILAETALNLFLILAPIWAIVMGYAMLKNKFILVNK